MATTSTTLVICSPHEYNGSFVTFEDPIDTSAYSSAVAIIDISAIPNPGTEITIDFYRAIDSTGPYVLLATSSLKTLPCVISLDFADNLCNYLAFAVNFSGSGDPIATLSITLRLT